MTLDYQDIKDFVLEMGVPRVGIGYGKNPPCKVLEEAIGFLETQGQPFKQATRVLCFLILSPKTIMEELDDVAALFELRTHAEAEVVWTPVIHERFEETMEAIILIVAGRFV